MKSETATKPAGFFGFLRDITAKVFGNPEGVLEGRGRSEHNTRTGPGRRRNHRDNLKAGSKLSRAVTRDGLQSHHLGIVSKAFINIEKGKRAA